MQLKSEEKAKTESSEKFGVFYNISNVYYELMISVV